MVDSHFHAKAIGHLESATGKRQAFTIVLNVVLGIALVHTIFTPYSSWRCCVRSSKSCCLPVR